MDTILELSVMSTNFGFNPTKDLQVLRKTMLTISERKTKLKVYAIHNSFSITAPVYF